MEVTLVLLKVFCFFLTLWVNPLLENSFSFQGSWQIPSHQKSRRMFINSRPTRSCSLEFAELHQAAPPQAVAALARRLGGVMRPRRSGMSALARIEPGPASPSGSPNSSINSPFVLRVFPLSHDVFAATVGGTGSRAMRPWSGPAR